MNHTILLCASAFLIQSIAGQAICCGSSVPVSSGCGCGAVSVPSTGGAFIVQSLGPLAPAGIAAATELALAAELAVSGAVPFLSAVAFDGQLPTSGAASAAYGCGDGSIAITQELGNPGGSNAANAAGLALNNVGLGSCSAISQGCGCGCGSSINNNLGSYSLNNLNGLSSGLAAPAVSLGSSRVAVPAASLGSSGLLAPAVNQGSYGPGNAALSSESAGACSTYGGAGTGQVGVAGDVAASGNTVIAGSVPVLGAVDFSGVLPASGSVYIPGQCGCGCQ